MLKQLMVSPCKHDAATSAVATASSSPFRKIQIVSPSQPNQNEFNCRNRGILTASFYYVFFSSCADERIVVSVLMFFQLLV
jgi:hypothetical protein